MEGDKILYRGNWHYAVKKEFVFNANLSRDARFLYLVLLSFTNKDNKEVFPSREYLVNILGCADRTLSKYIGELKLNGFIKIKKERSKDGKFDHNVYELFDYSRNNHRHWGAYGTEKNEESTTGTFTVMVDNTTKMVPFLKNNISIAQFLITDYDFSKEDNITKLAKVINKYKSELGEADLRRIIFYLLGRVLNKEMEFHSIESLAKYLEGCLRKKKENQVPEVWELNTYE